VNGPRSFDFAAVKAGGQLAIAAHLGYAVIRGKTVTPCALRAAG
jgi:hypothetical protein